MLIPCQVVLANPPWRESGPRGKKSPEYADLSSSQRVKFWPQMETGPFFIIFQLNPFKDLLKILVITTNIFTHYLLLFLLKKKNFIYVAAPGLSCGMWDLVLCPGIKPGAPALGVWSFGHWTMREVLIFVCLVPLLCSLEQCLGNGRGWVECLLNECFTACQ